MVSMGGKVRELHHQNVQQSKADTELINRFERTHGHELEMHMPKKPPLQPNQQFAQSRNSVSAFSSRGCSPARSNYGGGTWNEIIART